MKIFTTIRTGILKTAAFLLMAAPAVVSCYDDSALREITDELQKENDEINDKIDMIIESLEELRESVNTEIAALHDMMKGNAMIKSVVTDSNGITTVVLTDGKTLLLYPKANMQSFITYMTASVDGENVDCWAYIDEEGVKRYLRDAEGNPIPVDKAVPEVIEKDGELYISIGGAEYPMSGTSVFSDYELVVDELTGEVYAVTFTFGENMTFTVTVDGACGFYFVAPTGGFGGNVIIDDYYVANGTTDNIQVDARGVVDYLIQAPDGWKVKDKVDEYMGNLYFQVTAPKKELVESGAAESEGYLKVMSVLEGGKASVTKLYLTSAPFSKMSVSFGKADVKMYNGLQKFVYGVCPESDFDEASILETAKGLLTAYEYPAGYGLSNSDLVDEDLYALSGSSLVTGQKYVFWALPALYFMTEEDAGYYVAEGTMEKLAFTYANVQFAVSDITFSDAKLTMALDGVSSYYTELLPAEEFLLEDVVFWLNNPGMYEAKTEPMSYEGSIFKFAGMEAEKAKQYVAWLAVAEDGKTYTEEDVVVVEFSTLNLAAGGSVNVEAGEAEVSALEIKVPLTAAGAETLYYSFLAKNDAAKYADDEAKAAYLFEKGLSTTEGSAVAAASETVAKMKPETEYVLFAVASDSEGLYGNVLVQSYKTTTIQYNDLVVKMELLTNDPGNVSASIAAEGAADFLYWIGKVADNTWKSPNYLAGSVETAQAYMYLNSTRSTFTSVMAKYPVADGKISMTDLALGEDYVIVAMAKAADGTYSKATGLFFKTRSIALGNIVYSTDSAWAEATPEIVWKPEGFEPATGMMMGKYTFTFDCPDHLTAFVLCGAQSYIDDGGNIKNMTTADEIIKIVEMTDKRCDKDLLVDDELWETTGSMDAWQWFHFSHGCALFGNAVVFADGDHVHENCKECSSYTGNNEVVVYKASQGPVEFRQPYANAKDDADKVYVVYRDLDGNYYEPHVVDVPDEYFEVETE